MAVARCPASVLPTGGVGRARAWGGWSSGLFGSGVDPGVGEVLEESHVHVGLEDEFGGEKNRIFYTCYCFTLP